MYQLECRMKHAVILDKVLTKQPEWRQKSKSLCGPADHTNPSNSNVLELGEEKGCKVFAFELQVDCRGG